MAEKILKGINFPGLEDTYLVDNYVKTINGNAPDAEGNIEIEIGSGGSIAAVQSDWNQNDETNAAFIKNRPFYDSEIEVFNQELTFINGENTWHLNVVLEDLSDNTLVEGKNYTVIWDNTSYNCECYMLEDVPCLGNAGNAGHENLENGLPFFIARYNTEAMKVWAITLPEKDPSLNPESTIIYCKIKSDDVHKIDPKYIYQSDWNVIDENDAAYIKNKPFGKTVEIIKSIDWDGNTEGLTNIAEVFYKVSDSIFTDEQIKTCTIIKQDGSSLVVSQIWDDAVSMGLVTGDSVMLEVAIFIRRPTTLLGMAFNEPGVYFVKNSDVCVTSVTFSEPVEINTTVKTLDNKYLDFMERKSYFTLQPQQLDYELIVENDGHTFWQTSKTYSISQSEWEELSKLASNNKGVIVKVNDNEYYAPLNVSTTDSDGNPTVIWFGDTYKIEYPFFVMLTSAARAETVLLQDNCAVAAMPEYNGMFGYTTDAYSFDLFENLKCTVVWDDVNYEVTAFAADNFKDMAIAIGNGANIGYSTEGVPFLITELYKNGKHEVCIFAVNDRTSTSHSVKIIQNEQTVFQGMNWIAYDLLKDNNTQKLILSEQEINFDTFNNQFGGYTNYLSPSPCALQIGKQYTVVWDGVEYPVTGQDGSATIPNTVGIGDGRALGCEGNGEPFIISYCSISASAAPQLMFLSLVDAAPATHTITIYEENAPSAEFGVHTGTTYTWKIKKSYLPSDLGPSISWNDLKDKPFEETADGVKHLDNKYLDFIETSDGGNEIIPEQEISLFVNDNGDGTYSYTGGYFNYNGENIGTKDESFYNEMLKLQVGKEYIITYNGKEYKYSAIDMREEAGGNDEFTASIAIELGNPTGTLTEEHPIRVAVIDMAMSAEVYYVKMAGLSVLAFENSEPIISTFSIREASSSKIKKEYLPDDIGGSVNPDTLKFKSIILESSTEGSSKCFKITIDDTGTLSVEELGG